MNFSDAVRNAVRYFMFKAFTPTPVYTLCKTVHIPWLTSALNNTTIAFESLREHMLDIISDARAAETPGAKARTDHPASQDMTRPKEIKSGLLTNLMTANTVYNEGNVAGEKSKALTDEDLLSNTFVRSKTLSTKACRI